MIPETVDPTDVFGNTVFCDDIRHEIDGKISFIGTYPGGMQVHGSFPATVPKFAFSISLWQRRTVFQKKIELWIYLPEDEEEKPSVVSTLETPDPPEPTQSADALMFPGGPFVVMRAQIIMAGMVVKAPGVIRVRALREGKLFPIGSLPIRGAAAQQASPD